MTKHDTYTETEWERLRDLPRLAAFGAMAADEGDAVSSTRELWAGMTELMRAAHDRYPDNRLIQAIVAAETEDDEGADVTGTGWRPGAAPLADAVAQQALNTAREAARILAERATEQEAAAYTAWVLGIARAAAEGSRSGLFGVGGKRVSPREAAFLDALRAALGAE